MGMPKRGEVGFKDPAMKEKRKRLNLKDPAVLEKKRRDAIKIAFVEHGIKGSA